MPPLPCIYEKWYLLGLPVHVLHGRTRVSEDVRLGTVIPEWCLVVPVRLNFSWSSAFSLCALEGLHVHIPQLELAFFPFYKEVRGR